MRPNNTKDRRRAKLKFLGFFILSILPICVAIYLYGRVDPVENKFLRSEYEDIQRESEKTQEYLKAKQELLDKSLNVRNYLTQNAEEIKNYSSSGYTTSLGELTDDLETARSKFNFELRKHDLSADTCLINMAVDYQRALKRFTDIYDVGVKNLEKLSKDLESTKSEKDKLQRDLDNYLGQNY